MVHRAVRGAGAGRLGRHRRPAAGGAARPDAAGRPRSGAAQDPPAAELRRCGRRAGPAEVGRGVGGAAGAGAAARSGEVAPGPGVRAPRRRGAGSVRPANAVRADQGAAGDRRADRLGPDHRAPDEPPGSGRGRQRQDRGGAARDAAGGGLRSAGCDARPDRGTRGAARALAARAAWRPCDGRRTRRRGRRHPRDAANRLAERGATQEGSAGGSFR